jgi:hypothetical protein
VKWRLLTYKLNLTTKEDFGELRIPEIVEHELMEKLLSAYVKTIHTWYKDQERVLPVGSYD